MFDRGYARPDLLADPEFVVARAGDPAVVVRMGQPR